MLVVLCVMKKALCVWKYDLKAFISNPDYRICSIRRHGYYLFHRAILCGFYLRAATNWERRLLNSVFLVKFFVIVRAFEKSQFYKINEGIVMQLHQPPLCCKVVPTQHFQFIFFQWFHTMIALRASKLLWTVCVLVPIPGILIWYCHSSPRFIHVRMCYSNICRG